MRLKRIVIYPKDIQRITGKSERYGRLMIQRIKQELKKDDHQLVTISEFSDYAGIDIQELLEFITD
jgi:GTP-sensing pleiotropic transcriptional regulator CodY